MTKFPLPLPLKDSFSLFFPKGAHVLHVATEGRNMWLVVNHDANVPTDTMSFLLAREGDRLPPGTLVYLGSFRFRRVMRRLFEHLPETEAVTSGVATNRKLYAERNPQAER